MCADKVIKFNKANYMTHNNHIGIGMMVYIGQMPSKLLWI